MDYLYVIFSTSIYSPNVLCTIPSVPLCTIFNECVLFSVFVLFTYTIFNEYLRVIFTFEIGFDAAEDGPLNVCETLAKVVEKI